MAVRPFGPCDPGNVMGDRTHRLVEANAGTKGSPTTIVGKRSNPADSDRQMANIENAVDSKPWLIALALCVIGASSHLLPHPAGMSTVGAIGMLAAAYLPRHLVPLPVLVSVATADIIIGTYGIASMALVYIAHLAGAAGVVPLLARVRVLRIGGAAVVSAVIFYLISNAAPMTAGYYPNTVSGWITCYAAGLPFLLRGIAANLIFGTVAFASVRGLLFILERWVPLPNR